MAAQPEPPKTAAAAKSPKPADPKAPAAGKPAAEGEKPKRRSGKLMVLIAVLVLLIGGGGAGAFVFLSGEESGDTAEAAAAPEAPAVFVPLEIFTVNLLPSDGLHQYLQTSLTLKLTSQTTADAVKTRMPEVRNRILMILSAKRPGELMPTAGKQKLATEISQAVHGMVERAKPADGTSAKASPPPAAESAGANGSDAATRPIEVLFTAFIIQ